MLFVKFRVGGLFWRLNNFLEVKFDFFRSIRLLNGKYNE